MSKQKLPETSLAAYRSLVPEELNETYKLIIHALRNMNEATFEEIAAWLKVEKSRVWKRMSELERMDIVYRPGNKRTLKSGRSGFTWMLCENSIAKTDIEQNQFKKGITTAAQHASKILKQQHYTQSNLL